MSRQSDHPPALKLLMAKSAASPTGRTPTWLNRTVLGIVLATFFSDFGHELCTSVLPLFLASGVVAAMAILTLVREPAAAAKETHDEPPPPKVGLRLPPRFWMFLFGVGLFGLGDFSRTFVVYLAAKALEEYHLAPAHGGSLAVLVYVGHNFVSALAAFPIGWLGDHFSKGRLLAVGYALGAATNLLLAWQSGSLAWLLVAVVGSGIYIAVEETLEKATAATLLPRAQRSLGFGVLAGANAVGDMVSSVYVGWLLERDNSFAAFGTAALFGLFGAVWIAWLTRRGDSVAKM